MRALILSMVTLVACGSGAGQPSGSATGGRQPVPVRAAAVAERDVPEQLAAIGNVEAYSTVTVKSLVEGQLASVGFEEGQEVRRGDLLFTIDPRPFEAAVHQAEANVARDLAQAKHADAEAERFARLLSEG